MKKILLTALAAILVLALCAGCANNNTGAEGSSDSGATDVKTAATGGAEADEKPGDLTEGWPASDLPDGFPKYPNGKTSFDSDTYGVFVYIKDTDIDSFEGFLDELADFGFKFKPRDEEGAYYATKRTWAISLHIKDDMSTATFLIYESSVDMGSEEWPAELPEYVDGDIKSIRELIETNSIYIEISNSSIESMGEYSNVLIEDGWDLRHHSNDGNNIALDKGVKTVLLYMSKDGSIVIINLMELDFEEE